MEIREQCDSNYITLLQEKEMVLLENYLSPRGLTIEGQELLLETLEHMLSYGQKLICDHIFAFSTSILRYAFNREEILNKLQMQLDLSAQVLTGAQQAELSCKEIVNSIETRCGLGCQIGGGSTQIFFFRDGQIQDFISIPLGHAMLYNRHVASVLPTSVESQKIKQDIINAIKEYPFPKDKRQRTIYMMGECCENVAKLHFSASGNVMPDLTKKRQMHGRSININDYNLLSDLLRNRNLNGAALLNRMFPDCTTTVFPTMLIMEAIGIALEGEEHVVVKGNLEGAYFNKQISQMHQLTTK